MAFIFTTVFASLAFLAAVFAVVWVGAAFFSSTSDTGHLTPKLSLGFISSAFVMCIFAFPVVATLGFARIDDNEIVDLFLVNAVVVLVMWNFTRRTTTRTGNDGTPAQLD